MAMEEPCFILCWLWEKLCPLPLQLAACDLEILMNLGWNPVFFINLGWIPVGFNNVTSKKIAEVQELGGIALAALSPLAG